MPIRPVTQAGVVSPQAQLTGCTRPEYRDVLEAGRLEAALCRERMCGLCGWKPAASGGGDCHRGAVLTRASETPSSPFQGL